MTFKVERVSNEKRGRPARPAREAVKWRTEMRWGGMGEKRRRYNKKCEGTVRAFPLLQAPPAALLSLPLDHFSLSLIFPTTANHLCCHSPSTACPIRSLAPFLYPHKWLCEAGQVLWNSACSSTCLIQGLAHCTKTSNTLAHTRTWAHKPHTKLHVCHHVCQHQTQSIYHVCNKWIV